MKRAAGLALLLLFACDADSPISDYLPLAGEEGRPATETDFYSYETSDGRTVYVNHESMLPPEHRDEAQAIDLSEVSLNEELGRELHESLVREHVELSEGEHCEEAQEVAEGSPIELAIRENGHLIAVGGVIALLLLTAPWIGRRVGFPRWVRTLTFVIPILLLLGGIAHVAVTTSRVLQDMRASAELCDPTDYDDTSPQGRTERRSAVSQLRTRIEQAALSRQRSIDRQIEEATR